LRDPVGQPGPVGRIGLPQMHLGVDDHFIPSELSRKLGRAPTCTAMASTANG
jgi:hypothetical protein